MRINLDNKIDYYTCNSTERKEISSSR